MPIPSPIRAFKSALGGDALTLDLDVAPRAPVGEMQNRSPLARVCTAPHLHLVVIAVGGRREYEKHRKDRYATRRSGETAMQVIVSHAECGEREAAVAADRRSLTHSVEVAHLTRLRQQRTARGKGPNNDSHSDVRGSRVGTDTMDAARPCRYRSGTGHKPMVGQDAAEIRMTR